MLCTVIPLISRSWCPIVSELFLGFSVSEPPQFHVHPISINLLRSGIIFLDVVYNAAISDSAADAITVLMICATVKTGPLSFGFGSFSKRSICAPAWLLAFDSLINPASACAANIISLFLKVYRHQSRLQHNPGAAQLHILFLLLLPLVGPLWRPRLIVVYC